MRPTMKLTGDDLDRLLLNEDEPPTTPRPDLTAALASTMNRVPELPVPKIRLKGY